MQLRAGLRRLLFVVLVASIIGVSSERMFWYWSDQPLDHLVVTMVYAPAAAGCLWFLGRYRVRDFWGLVLVAPLVGYFVEGVITPIVYVGFPVPFFPVWFAFWHGVLGLIVMVVGIRHLLLARRTRALTALAVGLGTFWGLWSTTMWLPENVDDPELIADHGGPLQILGPADFAIYAATFTAVLAAAHWLLGRVWMTEFRPSRLMTGVWVAFTAVAVIGWSVAMPWAAPAFLGGVALQRWGLRRHAAAATGGGVLASLGGTVRVTSLLPLTAIPIAAATTYAVVWAWDPPVDVVRYLFMYRVIGAQTVVGAILIGRSFVVARRMARDPHLGHDRPHAVLAHADAPGAAAHASPGADSARPGPVA